MITLTLPEAVSSQIGGAGTVNYDKVVVSPFTMDPVAGTITGTARMTSTAAPNMPVRPGRLEINANTGVIALELSKVNYRGVLDAGQKAAVVNIIANAQNALETGLRDLGILAGVHSAGV